MTTRDCQVAMTYSVELFICMILGLVLGHAIFNTGDKTINITACQIKLQRNFVVALYVFCQNTVQMLSVCAGAAVGESVDPCCASQAVTSEGSHDEAAIM